MEPTCVEHENVQPVSSAEETLSSLFDALQAAQFNLHDLQFVTGVLAQQLLLHDLPFGNISGGVEDRHAGLGQSTDDFKPDAAGAAGDQGHFVRQLAYQPFIVNYVESRRTSIAFPLGVSINRCVAVVDIRKIRGVRHGVV